MTVNPKQAQSSTEADLAVHSEEIAIEPKDVKALGANLNAFYSKNFPCGENTIFTLTVTGLPANSRFIFATPQERTADGRPHAGDASFALLSAALSADGTEAKIRYRHNWGATLQSGVSMLYG